MGDASIFWDRETGRSFAFRAPSALVLVLVLAGAALVVNVLGSALGHGAMIGAPGAGRHVPDMPAARVAAPGGDTQTVPPAYVPLRPVSAPLGTGRPHATLRFAVALEVPRPHAPAIRRDRERVIAALTTFLGTVEARDLEAPDALAMLRAQFLRQSERVLGRSRVTGLVWLEFDLI